MARLTENASSSSVFEPAQVARRLLDWYGRHGRDLPWRRQRDPYRIWLSEIMLQQTTVAAVIPYYERFLQTFPSLQSLSRASLDDVIKLWAGLGYYSRARNLHQAAIQLVRDCGGQFPTGLDQLMALPGVGRSTAGAIRSIAFDLPAPILDGNVRRVLVRLFAWEEDPRSSRADKQFWQWAGQLMSFEQPHDYAQAIMDLGATICTPRDPACLACPLKGLCQAWQCGKAADLPLKRGGKKKPVRQQAVLLVRVKNRMQVGRRPPTGLLGGLWQFPLVDVAADLPAERAIGYLLQNMALPQQVEFIGRIQHVYSHFKLNLAVFAVSLKQPDLVAESGYQWCHVSELAEIPLHGAHRKALALYLESALAADGME